MHSRVWSSATVGIDAVPIEIETDIRPGLPRHRVVGLPHGAVRESLDRIWSAIANSRMSLPRGVLTINLAPAELRKDSASLDLPIAMGVLAVVDEGLAEGLLGGTMILGELALDGSVRPVRGVLAAAIEAKARGFDRLLVPASNAAEGASIRGISVFGIGTLEEACVALRGDGRLLTASRQRPPRAGTNGLVRTADFSEVSGQEQAKRALEIAAAGAHNVLFVGPPGAGKTMLARRLPSILPAMDYDESLDVSRIYSSKGLLESGVGLLSRRPFRAPHHTISDVGLCGGGSDPAPGEISLAHNGVLFLDELPEFRRSALEVLRQPLEEGNVRITRSRVAVEFPARFILVASMNPCPCGYLSHPSRDCICNSAAIMRYASRISGPLLDRVDLHVPIAPVDFGKLVSDSRVNAESSAAVRTRVVKARRRQARRLVGTGDTLNGRLQPAQIRRWCELDGDGQSILREASRRLGLSARAVMRTLKVARTIADLSSSDKVGSSHVAEAIQFRSIDRFGLPTGSER